MSSTSATPAATRTGPGPLDEVRGFAHEITKYLLDEHDVKLIVIACNNAAAAALDDLQSSVAVPVIGVIEPGVRSLISATRSGSVGVIATAGTVASGAYQRAVAATGAAVELTCAACPGFVEFVERGETGQRPGARARRTTARAGARRGGRHAAARLHALPLPRSYDHRRDGPRRRARVVGRRDRVRCAERLLGSDLAAPTGRTTTHRFFSSGDPASFSAVGGRLFGPELAHAETVPWA